MVKELPRHYRTPPPPFQRPTALEVTQRQLQIEQWRATVDRQRLATRIVRQRVVPALAAIGILGVLVGWWAVPAVAALLAWLALRITPPTTNAGEQPKPLSILPFTPAENEMYMLREDPEPFSSVCACPGCGDWKVHHLGGASGNVVLRECALCQRKWKQRQW